MAGCSLFAEGNIMALFNSKNLPLAVILASGTLTVMTGSIIAPVVNLMRDGLGATASTAGIIITMHSVFMALSSPILGSIIDRKGVKWPFVFGLIGYGIAGGSGVFINSYWLLLLSRAVLGIALASFFAATSTMILTLYEDTRRVRVMGWHGSAQSLGGVIWPMLGGALGVVSWHLPFSVYTVAIPMGLLAVWSVPKQVSRRPSGRTAKENTVLRIFRENPVLFLIYGLMFYINFTLYGIVVYLPPLLEAHGIVSSFRISLFITTITASAGVVSLFYWRIRARLSYWAIAKIAVLLGAVSFWTISHTTRPAVIACATSLFGVGMSCIIPTVVLWIGDIAPPSFRGRFSAYLGMTGYIGQFMAPLLLGPLVSARSLNSVFLCSTGISVLMLSVVFFVSRKQRA